MNSASYYRLWHAKSWNFSLDGELEALAASARKPFDAPPDMKAPGSETIGGGTPFFGDTMPLEDIRLQRRGRP